MRSLSSGEERSGGVGREVHACYYSGGRMFRLRRAMEGNKVCRVRDLQTSGVLWTSQLLRLMASCAQGKMRGSGGEWDGGSSRDLGTRRW
jgi:hypothetical protein